MVRAMKEREKMTKVSMNKRKKQERNEHVLEQIYHRKEVSVTFDCKHFDSLYILYQYREYD